MATKRPHPRDSAPPVRSGKDSAAGGTRQLPPEFNRLAAGEDRLRKPRTATDARVRDPRERVLIPGTNNRDSRHVYDARLTLLRQALSENDDDALGQGLLEFSQLGLYRARNVVNMDAFTTSVLGLSPEQTQATLTKAAERTGQSPGVLQEPTVALWLRTEAALREHLGNVRVALTGQGADAQFHFVLPSSPIGRTVEALCSVGRQAAGLSRHLSEPAAAADPRSARERRPTVPQRPVPHRRPPER